MLSPLGLNQNRQKITLKTISRLTSYISRPKLFVPAIIGVVLLFIPLVRDFHIESAILAAVVGAFWAGIAATRRPEGRSDVRSAAGILGLIYVAGLPLLVLALITGCFTVHGLGFWLFLPAPSVFLGYSLGRLNRFFELPFPKTIIGILLCLVTLGSLFYEFLTLPQLYFFNHIWGYWPGPIYDEAITFPLSLVAFRFLTLCWILILWLIPSLHKDAIYKWIVGLAALTLVIGYTQVEQMQIITPNRHLQHQLGGERETEHARIYYANQEYSDREMNRLTTEVEFQIHQIKQSLQVGKPDSAEKIELYLYADVWQKKQLVGAKYTSYVTVWQGTPQIHIAKGQIDGSLKHEVAHAVTALLEWPGLLPNIGLTEGIAVALAPDRSPQSTIDQLVAASEPYPSATEMQSALSYWGFYAGRAAVSYTTAGSFVRYLVETRPAEQFVQAYQCGDVDAGYEEPFAQLIAGWHQRLDSVRIDSSDQRRASDIFGQPSIFEQRCPHKVPRATQLYNQFLLNEVRGDTAGAIEALDQLKELDPAQYSPTFLWMFWNLTVGQTAPVIQEADPQSPRIELQLLTADAFRMEGQKKQAQQYLNRAIVLSDKQADTTYQEAIAIRLDSLQWSYDLDLRYNRTLLDLDQFEQAYYRNKIRAIENTFRSNLHTEELLSNYASRLQRLPVDMKYFGTYLAIIHRLAYNGHFNLANQWIEKLSAQDLSLRYQERLQQQRDWLIYVSNVSSE